MIANGSPLTTKRTMTTKPSRTVTTQVWYIFIDVVEFTGQGRSIDDMVSIIMGLNGIVQDQLNESGITRRRLITLATGDGMCLGLLNSNPKEQITLAFALREAVESWNKVQTMAKLRFKLRTALNIYEDFKIKDINNKWNLIGHGINTAARILGLCEPGEIVVSRHMYSGLERHGEYMHAFSPERSKPVKGENYCWRRIEINKADRTWLAKNSNESKRPTSCNTLRPPEFKLTGELPDPAKTIRDMQAALENASSLPVEVGAPTEVGKEPKVTWPKPKLLTDDPLDEGQISDNKLRLVAVQGGAWQPSVSEPKKKVLLGHPTYSKEFPLKTPFRAFRALIAPNRENFELVMKLMNPVGVLSAHMVYGEVSVTIRNDDENEGVVLGFMEGGERYERTLEIRPRPRFEVDLKVLPVRSTKLHVALLAINSSRVFVKMIPQEFTTRFGIVAGGNGGPCHMSVSEIKVQTAAK